MTIGIKNLRYFYQNQNHPNFVGNYHAYLHAKKINFILNFFLKIAKNTKLDILGNLDMPGFFFASSLQYNVKKPLMFIYRQKNQLHTSRFPSDIANLLFWVLWACLGMHAQKWYYRPAENFDVYLHAKNKLHQLLFS